MGNLCGGGLSSKQQFSNQSTIGLTLQDKKCIVDTWKAFADDDVLVYNGVQLFVVMFDKEPGLKNYFSAFKSLQTTGELHGSVRMRAHAVTVMAFLSVLADYIDDSEMIIALAEKIGRQHYRLGVGSDAFEKLKPIFLEVIQTAVGPTLCNEQAVQAWTKVLDLLTASVNEGWDIMRKDPNGAFVAVEPSSGK